VAGKSGFTNLNLKITPTPILKTKSNPASARALQPSVKPASLDKAEKQSSSRKTN
jgi:hypothetical protein